MKILAVDYGDSHTGIAVCDPLEMLATPLCIIDERDFNRCAEKTAFKTIYLEFILTIQKVIIALCL